MQVTKVTWTYYHLFDCVLWFHTHILVGLARLVFCTLVFSQEDNNMKPNITFIQMGGTIDKAYPKAIGGYAFDIGEAAFITILNDLQPSFRFETNTICQKDSQDITIEDRQQLRDFIFKSDCSKFVITHGTDTMIETGHFISTIPKKTIVLTGSLKPAAFKQSDAPIQLGAAIAASQLLSDGILHCNEWDNKNQLDDIGRDSTTGKFI